MTPKRLTLITLLIALLIPAPRAAAAPRATFTLIVHSIFTLVSPQDNAPATYSIFKDETYPIIARNAQSTWVQLELIGADKEAWVRVEYGIVKGNLGDAPIKGDKGVAATTPRPQPPIKNVLPAISARARDIYQTGLLIGNNPRAFSKIGDCNSVTPFFLAPFDSSEYRLGDYKDLQETINHFGGSFARDSMTARVGFNTASLFSRLWADPNLCKGENPLECEYRLHRPSIAFVSLGTNGAWLTSVDYENGMRNIIDFLIARGVLPILSTKADDLDEGRFNPIVIKLAREYDVPLWDYRAAVEHLSNFGLGADAFHLTWGPSHFDQPIYAAWQWRNLTALQSLDAVWRGVR